MSAQLSPAHASHRGLFRTKQAHHSPSQSQFLPCLCHRNCGDESPTSETRPVSTPKMASEIPASRLSEAHRALNSARALSSTATQQPKKKIKKIKLVCWLFQHVVMARRRTLFGIWATFPALPRVCGRWGLPPAPVRAEKIRSVGAR